MSEIPTLKKEKKWKDRKESYQDALNYLQGRMKGIITSFKTPWPKFDDAGVEGLEWRSTIIIGGRPGAGKTLLKDQIIRESFKRNVVADFRVLEFQFEMLGQVSAIREFSNILGVSYTEACTRMTQAQLDICLRHAKEVSKYPIDTVYEPCSVNEFINIVSDYMETFSYMEKVQIVKKDEKGQKVLDKEGKVVYETIERKAYKKTVVTLDHSLLLKKGAAESRHDALYAFGEALTQLKRKYPILFLILSQLNRNIDTPERSTSGKHGNYVLESDFFGADALLQHADILVGMNKPSKLSIEEYGPNRYFIPPGSSIMALHFLKVRNGEPRLSFFDFVPDKMEVREIPTPISRKAPTIRKQ